MGGRTAIFAKVQTLDAFDGDIARVRAPRTAATVRHLATHACGPAYGFCTTDVARYIAATRHPTILSGLKSPLYYPLTFDPGVRRDYGIGIDGLGQVVAGDASTSSAVRKSSSRRA